MDILEGLPKNVLRRLRIRIKMIVNDPRVKPFRVGRSCDISKRKTAHKFDEIIPLYYRGNDEDAKSVESKLIDHFKRHSKCVNLRRNGGSFSPEYGNYIYLGLWF